MKRLERCQKTLSYSYSYSTFSFVGFSSLMNHLTLLHICMCIVFSICSICIKVTRGESICISSSEENDPGSGPGKEQPPRELVNVKSEKQDKKTWDKAPPPRHCSEQLFWLCAGLSNLFCRWLRFAVCLSFSENNFFRTYWL